MSEYDRRFSPTVSPWRKLRRRLVRDGLGAPTSSPRCVLPQFWAHVAPQLKPYDEIIVAVDS